MRSTPRWVGAIPDPVSCTTAIAARQYAASDYRKRLAARGITVSMSGKGDCWDNAPMESLNGTLKVECVHAQHFATREQARGAIVEFIGYYNTERLHSSLGYMTPAEFEHRWHDERHASSPQGLDVECAGMPAAFDAHQRVCRPVGVKDPLRRAAPVLDSAVTANTSRPPPAPAQC